MLCLSSHRTTGINYANDMPTFLSENVRRKTTGNWKIFLLYNMSSAITRAGKGWEGKGCFQVATHWIHNQVQTCISFRSSFFTKRMGNYTSPFPSTVAKQRKATTSCQACTAVRSHYKIPTFVRRIFIYFILAGITNIWQEIHVWLKSGKINIHIPADLGDVQRVID